MIKTSVSYSPFFHEQRWHGMWRAAWSAGLSVQLPGGRRWAGLPRISLGGSRAIRQGLVHPAARASACISAVRCRKKWHLQLSASEKVRPTWLVRGCANTQAKPGELLNIVTGNALNAEQAHSSATLAHFEASCAQNGGSPSLAIRRCGLCPVLKTVRLDERLFLWPRVFLTGAPSQDGRLRYGIHLP